MMGIAIRYSIVQIVARRIELGAGFASLALLGLSNRVELDFITRS